MKSGSGPGRRSSGRTPSDCVRSSARAAPTASNAAADAHQVEKAPVGPVTVGQCRDGGPIVDRLEHHAGPSRHPRGAAAAPPRHRSPGPAPARYRRLRETPRPAGELGRPGGQRQVVRGDRDAVARGGNDGHAVGRRTMSAAKRLRGVSTDSKKSAGVISQGRDLRPTACTPASRTLRRRGDM